MSAEEDFLKRWSRRKREAAAAPPAIKPVEAAAKSQGDQPPETPEASFDPASLPPIDSITALSDITAFLRAGVPAELTHAALRRAWTADPAIRNFVGLAENAWDFTDPGAMPGFGPLESSDEVRRMIASIVERIGETGRPDPAEAGPDSNDVSNDSSKIRPLERNEGHPAPVASASDDNGEKAQEASDREVLLQSNIEDTAPQQEVAETVEKPQQSSRRTHGSALPR